jgi:hypothetical protein
MLTSLELLCLRKIAQGYSKTFSPCSAGELNRLKDLGLIEGISRSGVPLGWTATTYRLTEKGRAALSG